MKQKHSKSILFILVALLTISLAACGDSQKEQQQKAIEEAQKAAQQAMNEANTQVGKAMEQAKEVAAQANQQAAAAAKMAEQMGADIKQKVDDETKKALEQANH